MSFWLDKWLVDILFNQIEFTNNYFNLGII